MANTLPLSREISNSSLEGLHKAVQSLPYTLPKVEAAEPGLGYDADSERLHEAGYDAYITGIVAIAMANRYGVLEFGTQAIPDSPHLSPFYNKLYLRNPDIPYMDLAGESLEPRERARVFHVQFPKEWKNQDLTHQFKPFGHVSISWVDDTSAFVSLIDQEQQLQEQDL